MAAAPLISPEWATVSLSTQDKCGLGEG